MRRVSLPAAANTARKILANMRVHVRMLGVAALLGLACGTSLRTVQKPTARTFDDPKIMPLRFPTVPNSMRHFLASACSGAAGVTCLAPVEVLRLSFMSKGETFKGAVASLGAPKTWLRGNSADTLSTALKIGITMPTFALYKNAITTVCHVPEDAPTPRWAVFLAGALAGCTATCLCYPLDVVPRRGHRLGLGLGMAANPHPNHALARGSRPCASPPHQRPTRLLEATGPPRALWSREERPRRVGRPR